MWARRKVCDALHILVYIFRRIQSRYSPLITEFVQIESCQMPVTFRHVVVVMVRLSTMYYDI